MNALPTTRIDTLSDVELPVNFGTVQAQANLGLSSEEHGIHFSIALGGLKEVLIGRADHQTGKMPTIDLAPYDGQQLGVSRFHASIHWISNILLLTDLNSTNGTYLNGNRLVAHQERVIRNGDYIRVGKIKFRVSCE